MNYAIKLMHETRDRGVRKIDGYSGKIYVFPFDKVAKAYIYHPHATDDKKARAEVEDIFGSMGRSGSRQFCPINLPFTERGVKAALVERLNAAAAPKASDVTITISTPKEPAKTPLPPEVIEMGMTRGVIVTEDDDYATASRLIAAYDKGVKDALAAKRPKKLKEMPL